LRPGLEHVVIEIGGARVLPGDRVPVEVTLRTGGQNVYGIAHAIGFTPYVRIAKRVPGGPACALDAGTDATARFEFEPSGCDVDVDCARVRVAITARAPLADGTLLYRCAVDAVPYAEVGTQRLANVDVGASGPRGEVLATRGLDGIISIVPRPTPTIGPTPPPEVFLRLGTVSGQRGERVALTVHLDARGHDIAGVQNDIDFDPEVAIRTLSDGRPDCSVNPSIGKSATAFAFQPAGCAGTQCAQVRALVLSLENTDPIPDGALLYTCQIDIAPTAVTGAHPLGSSNVGASTPDGDPIPAGAVGGSITVLGTGSVRQTSGVGTAGRLCSGGDRQSLPCDGDADCPFGACAGVQGVCDGGADDGLLCDCPGGTCGGRPVCGIDPQRGTCRAGDLDGQCCDRAFNCGDGAACTRTFKLCASGPSKGIPCLDDHHCVGAACIVAERSCKGGAFHGSSCIDDADCPLGACVSPERGPNGGPQPTPTFTPAISVPVGSSHDGGGCTIGGSPARGGAWLLFSTLLLLVARRLARR
jgi:hypothetical protein